MNLSFTLKYNKSEKMKQCYPSVFFFFFQDYFRKTKDLEKCIVLFLSDRTKNLNHVELRNAIKSLTESCAKCCMTIFDILVFARIQIFCDR